MEDLDDIYRWSVPVSDEVILQQCVNPVNHLQLAVLIKRIQIDTGYLAQRFTERIEFVKKIHLDIETDNFRNETGKDDDVGKIIEPQANIKYVL